jgi:hypothetical protein
MRTILLPCVLAVIFTSALLAQQFTPPAMPAGASGKGEAVDCEVVKVYSLEDQGASYRAYAVKYKGTEVIAPDTLATSKHKVGDIIKVIVARVEMPLPTGKHKGISFAIMPTFSALPKKP